MAWEYTREESSFEHKTGKMRCVITNVEEAVSKTSGNPMIVVTVTPSESKAKVKNYIVKNKYFNQNMTRFFDSFPSIGEGNFNFLSWIGAEGAANFVTDEDDYLKVKSWIPAIKAENLPPFVGEKPVKQEVYDYEEIGEDDDLPF